MRIVIFDDNYPDETNLPGDMFAHTRVRLYAQECKVLVLRRAEKSKPTTYEGVEIFDYRSSAEALAHCRMFQPDVACVHFANEPFISEISPNLECPLLVWVHGIEALAWYTSLYNMKASDWLPHRVLFRIRRSSYRMRTFGKLIDSSNAGAKIHFVFVSHWMLSMCEVSVLRRVRHRSIIPNPIDTSRFRPSPKADRLRNVLVIRSSHDMKYRPDVVASVVKRLMSDQTGRFKCRIFSDGALFDKYFAPLGQIPGVEVYRKFLPQEQIVEQHMWAGFFLCPTAQDAQGVSMCEAMASGLIVATTPVTAIPEFVSEDMAVLSKTAAGLTAGIVNVASDTQRAARMSSAAAGHIATTLNAADIVRQELDLMERYAFSAAS